jgi:glycosyltransferase involved in cell wall biosynthesis
MDKKLGISIIIAAYDAKGLINQTLDSIQKQEDPGIPFEVLIGIDNCQETLNELESIRERYTFPMRIFMMESNTGPYIVYNSIFKESQYEYIHIFGADDIMLPDMLSEIAKYIPDYDLISNKFETMVEGTGYVPYGDYGIAAGVMTFNHKILKKVGGYKPWRCSGDSEFRIRVKNAKIFSEKVIDEKVGFKYRVHAKSLTNDAKSREGSELRRKYRNEMEAEKLIPLVYVKRITNQYTEI